VLEASNEFKVVAAALEEKERSLQWRGYIEKMLVNSVMANKASERSKLVNKAYNKRIIDLSVVEK
jgi:hypothetical protein